MAYKRKRTFKTKRRSRRKSRVPRSLKTTKVVNLYRTSNTIDSTTFTLSGALTEGAAGYLDHTTSGTIGVVNFGSFGASFIASDIPNFSEYQSMFEEYRINKITLKMTPMATGAQAGAALTGATTQTAVMFHWCLDYDDAAAPTASEAGLDALRQRTGYRMRNCYEGNGRPIVISFTPKVYHDGEPRKAGWIDEGQAAIPHFGVKCITESISTGVAMSHFFKLETTFHVSVKGMQ